jgi:hypothetical protein
MADDRETNGTLDPVAKPFVDFWSDYTTKANDATREIVDGINSSFTPKSVQRKWFDAVAKSMDAYMRSPVFLQAMKHNADAVIKVKQQSDDLVTEFARNANIPMASDISGLFERLHSVEEVILARLGRIEDKLQAIEEQVGAGQLVGR